MPSPSWLYPVSHLTDYRLPENREHGFLAYAEAMYSTGELHQQLRLMDWTLDPTDLESKFWLCFLWGACYNAITPWVMLTRFRGVPRDEASLARWYNRSFERQRFDVDCRYRKSKMLACIASYRSWLDGRSQADALLPLLLAPPADQYRLLSAAANSWYTFGRLSVWNWIEAVAVVTRNQYALDSPNFLLCDRVGSESNRNGVACVSGHHELYTKHGKLKDSTPIADADTGKLEAVAESLFVRARDAFSGRPGLHFVSRLNMETVFCWYKKMFSRPTNSRYLGWDGDRTWEELRYLESHWPEYPVLPLYDARAAALPDYLRAECLPSGCVRGVNKTKMAIFSSSGLMPDVYHHQNREGHFLWGI